MTWTEAVTARDARYDAWARDHYSVSSWEQLTDDQLREMCRAQYYCPEWQVG
jgi:hypothetical protein